MDIFDTSEIPEAYKTHLPPETSDPKNEAKEMLLEPFARVSQKVKDSLSRIYRVASQPMSGEEVVKPLPAESNPVEYYGSLAARIIAMPLVAMKEVYDLGTSARTGAPKLRGGPAGEGDWSPEQYKVAADATFTAGAALGGGMPGGGTGPANIGRKDALKMLAGEFRAAKRAPSGDAFIRDIFKAFGLDALTAKEFTGPLLPPRGSSYRTITKGLKNIPDEILAPVKEVGLTPSSATGIYGKYDLGEKRVSFNVTKKLPEETVPHEFLHATQHKAAGVNMYKMPRAVIEAHANEFEAMFLDKVKSLPKGEKIDAKTFKELYANSIVKMIEKHGTDYNSYSMKSINKDKQKLRSLRSEVPFKPKEILDTPRGLGRIKSSKPFKIRESEVFAQQGDSLLIREEAGSYIVSKKGMAQTSKPGGIVKTPHAKVKYDKSFTWEEGGPEMHQYTIQEGPAKGATFSAKSQSMDEISKLIEGMIKMRTK